MAGRRKHLRTAAILGALAIPFGLAAYQERTQPPPSDAWDEAEADAELAPVPASPPPRESMPASFFADVLGTGGVALAGDLDGAVLGASRAELEGAAPALWQWAERGEHPRYPQAIALLSFDADRLAAIRVVLPDRDGRAREALGAAWGVPLAARWADGAPRAAWLDEDARLRVTLVDDGVTATLLYERYLPLTALLADAGDRFGFAARPLLGASADDLAADFAGQVVHRDAGSLLVVLPPTEFSIGPTSLHVALADGHASGYWLTFEEPAADRALALVEARWGPAERSATGGLRFERVPGASMVLESGTVQLAHQR